MQLRPLCLHSRWSAVVAPELILLQKIWSLSLASSDNLQYTRASVLPTRGNFSVSRVQICKSSAYEGGLTIMLLKKVLAFLKDASELLVRCICK